MIRSTLVGLEGVSPQALRIPPAPPGLRVGLLGGSFNPPHEGHLLVAETAMRRLDLDRIWWLVSPGNPLKRHDGLRPLAERLRLSERLAENPRIVVTGFEASHAVRYTADLVALVRRRRPGARFVWIMGADSLAGFHRWQDWQRIADTMPIAVVDRPGATLSTLSSPMALRYGDRRVGEEDARLLPALAAPAWVFLHGPRSVLSSTGLRDALS